ncbi:uncharacterized protein V2V93DRAFT_376712 [Kockiozyma suomiensis]|uniref:uncharacterized protein n=1 Tax=Kockiozyma suomiensis TaxID=1337062 RepID=UPI003343E5F0
MSTPIPQPSLDSPALPLSASPSSTMLSDPPTQLTRSLTRKLKRRFTLPRSLSASSSSANFDLFPHASPTLSRSDSSSNGYDTSRHSIDADADIFASYVPQSSTTVPSLSSPQRALNNTASSSSSLPLFITSDGSGSGDLTGPSTPRLIQDQSFFEISEYSEYYLQSPTTSISRDVERENEVLAEINEAEEIARQILDKVKATSSESWYI